MILLAIVIALLLEQVRPLPMWHPVAQQLHSWTRWVARNVDTGGRHHAWLAWSLAALAPALGVAAIYTLVQWLGGWPLALLWSAGVLYVTFGLRRFSHHFAGLRQALEAGDDELAQRLLAQWQQVPAAQLARTEIPRLALEQSVLRSHHQVFGVLAWFCIGAMIGLGPAGAVLYRRTNRVAREWQHQSSMAARRVSPMLSFVSALAWYGIDWVPVRMTALCIAIVGSFEDAVEAWRRYAHRFANPNEGVILSTTAGALGIRLGTPWPPSSAATSAAGAETESLPGAPPTVSDFSRLMGLVWRILALWLLLLVLLTLAHVLG